MSKYTTEERYICEEKAGRTESVGYDEIDDVLDECWDKIFTTDAPIFDEEYRKPLCKKILKHFWNREIGAETAGLWMLWMNRTLEEQLPYYNQLYKSALLKFPIFSNVDYSTKRTRENTGETTNDQTGNETGNTTRSTTGDKSVITDGTKNTVIDTDTTDIGTSSKNYEETVGETWTEHDQDITENSSTKDTHYQETGSSTDDLTNSHNDTTNTESTKKSENDHWDKYSDTPEGALNNITDNKYLTDIREVTDDGTDKFNETVNNTGGYTNQGKGTTDKESNTYEDGPYFNELKSNTDERMTNSDRVGEEQGNTTDTGTVDTTQDDVYHDDQETLYHENETVDNTKDTVYNALGSSHDLEDFIEHVGGKNSGESYSEMLLHFRDTFLNIDLDLIQRFEENFMQLW